MSKKVADYTLGCKVNSYDTDAMMALFAEKGYDIVDFSEFADIYIINTCTVTNLGDKKSRQMIRRAKAANPDALVAATGCYAQVAPEEVSQIEGIGLTLGTKDRLRIVEEVERAMETGRATCAVSALTDAKTFENLTVSKQGSRTRAFLKIQEGCEQFCSYCIIPHARGPVRSRRPEDVLTEVRALAANGFLEIVLAGIHVASYGKDLNDADLLSLLAQVHDVPGISRIRLSSMEPNLVDGRFTETLAKLPKICDHFHMSLQSGCDKTLRKMNRKYDTKQYEAAVSGLRAVWPNVAVTTDIIVGFPGETEADFAESLAFVRRIGFSKLHVFPYSPKKGTPAARFNGQLSATIKQERSRQMIELGNVMSRQFALNMVGKQVRVLFERQNENGDYVGHTTNYVTAFLASEPDVSNEIITACVTAADGDRLRVNRV